MVDPLTKIAASLVIFGLFEGIRAGELISEEDLLRQEAADGDTGCCVVELAIGGTDAGE